MAQKFLGSALFGSAVNYAILYLRSCHMGRPEFLWSPYQGHLIYFVLLSGYTIRLKKIKIQTWQIFMQSKIWVFYIVISLG